MTNNNKKILEKEYCRIRHLLSSWDCETIVPSSIEEQYRNQLIEAAEFSDFLITLIFEHMANIDYVLLDCNVRADLYKELRDSMTNFNKKAIQYKQCICYNSKDTSKRKVMVNGEKGIEELELYANQIKNALVHDKQFDLEEHIFIDPKKYLFCT